MNYVDGHWERNCGLLETTIVFLKYLSDCVVFVCGCALLGYWSIVIVRSDVRHVVVIGKSVGTCCQSEVSSTVSHIQTDWSTSSDKILKMFSKLIVVPSIHWLTPVSEPSWIDFSSKNKRIVGSQRSNLDIRKLSHSSSLTQSNMCSRPIVFLIEPGCIFDIKLAIDIFIFPHSYEGLSVVTITVEGT